MEEKRREWVAGRMNVGTNSEESAPGAIVILHCPLLVELWKRLESSAVAFQTETSILLLVWIIQC